MLIIEAVFGAILMLGVGSYFGAEHQKQQEPVKIEHPRPENWAAEEHEKLVRVCALSCGEDRFKGYNVIFGKCECKE